MEIINLVNAIQEWHFLRHEILPFDLIVWEKMPKDPDEKYKHMQLAEVSYDFGVAGKMAALSEKYERILLITETLSAIYLVPRLSNLPKKANATVLQLNAGIAGFMSKSNPDLQDIPLMMPYANVREVYDQVSLFDALGQKGKNYIRVSHGDTQDAVFEKKLKAEGGIVDLRAHDFEGIAGTMIAPGDLLVHAIHAAQHLKQEGKSYDLFGLVDYNFSIGAALKESIIKTENIVFLLDQQPGVMYESFVKAKLWDAGLVDTQIHFIYPDIEKINTILPDHLWDEANRDGMGMAEKIHSLH